MSDYTTIELGPDFYSIEMGFVRGFLVVGDKEALLIDTGIGDQNLKEYVESITKLPITVLFTHADRDHVGGAGQFEKRLMHPCEFDYYKSRNAAAYPVEPVWEGKILSFGNYRFEVILIPGHTPGSVALLEKDKRFLIGGDSIQTGKIYMFGPGRNFDAFRASMIKLQGRLSEFDTVYASHNELIVPADTVCLLYSGAGKVMRGEVVGNPEERFEGKVNSYEIDGVAFYAVGY